VESVIGITPKGDKTLVVGRVSVCVDLVPQLFGLFDGGFYELPDRSYLNALSDVECEIGNLFA
jgi:hypothetical protein